MEQVVSALGGMLLRAVPTFILVLCLYIFLKKVFFNPLAKIMRDRYEATEGAMKAAREALATADARSAEFEQALREARGDIYRIHEHEREQLLEENAAQVRRARAEAEQRLSAAREELRGEVESAKGRLEQETSGLADSIAATVLKTRPGTTP